MAKIKITVKDAMAEIKLLTTEVNNLKTSLSGINKANADSFEKLSAGFTTLTKFVKQLGTAYNKLEATVIKSNKANKDAISSYDNLKKRLSEAKTLMNNLTTSRKQNTAAGIAAARSLKRVQAQYDAVNASVKIASKGKQKEKAVVIEVISAYERLIEKQLQAKAVIQEHIALGKTDRAELERKQKVYRELTAKINLARNATKSLKEVNLENAAATRKEANEVKRAVKEADALAKKNQHLNRSFVQLTNKQIAAKNAVRDAIAGQQKSRREIRKLEREYRKLTKQVNIATRSTTNFTSRAKKGFLGLAGGMKNLLAAFGLILGVQLIASLARNIFSLVKTFDGLFFALEKTTGGLEAAKDAEIFLLDITRSFGTELVSTTNRWIKFRAAARQSGLTLIETEDIFRSMTKAAGVLGLKTDELTGIYLALEQMLSKGKVTTEELRRQLGERLPGAMGIMAASMDVTISQLDKMLKKGEVLSAEVLPNFARAVEAAYGIETLKSVDTLIAAQNRMTTAWQNFVRVVFSDSSALKNFFNDLAGAINNIAFDFASPEGKQEILIGIETKALKERMNKLTKEELELLDRKAVLVKAKEDAIGVKVKAAWQLQVDEISKIITEGTLKRIEDNKLLASNNLMIIQKDLDAQLQQRKTLNKQLKRVQQDHADEIKDNIFGIDFFDDDNSFEKVFGDVQINNRIIKNQENFNFTLDETNVKIVELTAKTRLYRKLIEESNVEKFVKDDLTSRPIKELRKLQDQTLIIRNENLRLAVKHNQDIRDNEKSSFDERIDAIEKIADLKETILRNELKIETAILQAKLDKEIATQQKSIKNSSQSDAIKKEAQKKLDEFTIKAQEELDDKLIAMAIELQIELNAIKKSEGGDKDKVEIEINKKILDDIRDRYNLEIIELNKIVANHKEGTEARIKAEQRLKDISVLLAGEIIDANITVLESLILGEDVTEQWVKTIIQAINKLKASKKDLDPPEDGKLNWKEWADEISKILHGVADLVDAIFDNKIENINAEIEAESDKYDKLIELAGNNEEQQATLRRNKEAAIDKLEKKRLKEEQKQARVRKIAALAQIAINTALAISAATAQSFSLPPVASQVYLATQIALILATAALQAATVIAAPIPKFKKGGKITKKQIGMINDGGVREYIERQGNILSTNKKDALVNLQPHDIIYKDYDDMAKNSILMSAILNGHEVSKTDFDKLFFGISTSIKDGFKRVKINNNINIERNNDYYRNEMNRW